MELAADSALCPALHSSGDSSPFKSRALALSYSVLSRPSLALFPPYIRLGGLLLGQACVLESQEVGCPGALSPDYA